MSERGGTVNKTKHLLRELSKLFQITADDYNRMRLQRDKAFQLSRKLREELVEVKELYKADDYNRMRLQRDEALRSNEKLQERLVEVKESCGIESMSIIADLKEQLEKEKNLNFILQQRLVLEIVNNVV